MYCTYHFCTSFKRASSDRIWHLLNLSLTKSSVYYSFLQQRNRINICFLNKSFENYHYVVLTKYVRLLMDYEQHDVYQKASMASHNYLIFYILYLFSNLQQQLIYNIQKRSKYVVTFFNMVKNFLHTQSRIWIVNWFKYICVVCT